MLTCLHVNNRLFFVQVHNMKSDLKVIRTGVLQDSILGPLLFLLYIISSCTKISLFADDTAIECIL